MKATELKYALPYVSRFIIWKDANYWHIAVSWQRGDEDIEEQLFDARGGEKKTKTLDAMYSFVRDSYLKAGFDENCIRFDINR